MLRQVKGIVKEEQIGCIIERGEFFGINELFESIDVNNCTRNFTCKSSTNEIKVYTVNFKQIRALIDNYEVPREFFWGLINNIKKQRVSREKLFASQKILRSNNLNVTNGDEELKIPKGRKEILVSNTELYDEDAFQEPLQKK